LASGRFFVATGCKRFDFGYDVARFELIAEGDHSHHHHLVCTRGAAVMEIGESPTYGFTAVTHRLEFFGLCPKCQK